MCGIAGIIDIVGERDIDRSALKRMTDALRHRGPDGEGFFFDPGVGIGHRRLSIIDIEGGAQPFVTANQRGVLSFNGEIYNFKDLRTIFNQTTWRTRSDTEVLAEGLATKGFDFISSVNGMFAFAYWDRDEKTLTLARDRFGEKPLYYAETRDGLFLFASELKALVASGLIDTEINDEAFYDYLVFGFVPDPKSIYKDVYKLRAGERVVVRHGGKRTTERYWRATDDLLAGLEKRNTKSQNELEDELLHHLDSAVSRQLVADVPVTAFLSGGVDSSAIVSSIANTGNNVSAITVGFDDTKHDDRSYARLVAERYSLKHEEVLFPLNVEHTLTKMGDVYCEPFADPSALPTFTVCRATSGSSKVALSGDGADELFVVYRRYRMVANEMKIRRALPKIIREKLIFPLARLYPKADWAPRSFRAKTTLQSLGSSDSHGYAQALAINFPDRIRDLLSEDFLSKIGDYNPYSVIQDLASALPKELLSDPIRFAQAIDFETWLPGRMLTKIDRASMANSLEVRVPFLDKNLAKWANSTPTEMKLSGGEGKHILKAANKSRIPSDILRRSKRGFVRPTHIVEKQRTILNDELSLGSKEVADHRIDLQALAKFREKHHLRIIDFSQEDRTIKMWYAFLNASNEGKV